MKTHSWETGCQTLCRVANVKGQGSSRLWLYCDPLIDLRTTLGTGRGVPGSPAHMCIDVSKLMCVRFGPRFEKPYPELSIHGVYIWMDWQLSFSCGVFSQWSKIRMFFWPGQVYIFPSLQRYLRHCFRRNYFNFIESEPRSAYQHVIVICYRSMPIALTWKALYEVCNKTIVYVNIKNRFTN